MTQSGKGSSETTPAPRTRQPGTVRRRTIAEAALRIIAEKGLREFTSRSVAEEVGLTDAAIFRHFRNKEEIVLAGIEVCEEILFQDFPPRADDPLTRLGEFFLRRAERIVRHPGISRLIFSPELVQAAGAEHRRKVLDLKRRSVQFVRACLEEARERGGLRPDVECEEAALLVTGTLMALVFSHSGSAHPRSAPGAGPAAARAWNLLERLLRAEPAGETVHKKQERRMGPDHAESGSRAPRKGPSLDPVRESGSPGRGKGEGTER